MSYSTLIAEINNVKKERNGFACKRKQPFSITDFRINELYNRYFSKLSMKCQEFTFSTLPEDHDELLYLLRAHFQLWIGIQGHSITIHQEFPRRFRVTREVNPNNHWFSPKTFPMGSILYYGKDHYSVCNRNKGIPLSEIAPSNESEVRQPVVQINYDFIEVLED